MAHWPFVVHQTYTRQKDIHQLFGGQQQGGISKPVDSPGIFIFTGHGAGIIGYRDAFQTDDLCATPDRGWSET